jgi:phage shock protein C
MNKRGVNMMDEKRLVRPTTDRMVAGVAAGLADYMNLDPTIVRLLFVLLALAGGPGILIYIIMWLVMPEA